MADPTTVIAIALAVFAFGLFSNRIESTPLTAPMLFVALGLIAGPFGLGVIDLDIDGETTHLIIEVTLVLVLFTDAARIRFRELRAGYGLPARLLLVGLPLTIGLGFLSATWLFPTMSWAELALLAAVLAPTDAALGQVVVSSQRVPVRIRQALNVESGLNDGIAVPVVMVFLATAATIAGEGVAASHATESTVGFGFAAAQIGLGPVAGVVIAWPMSWLAQRAVRRKSIKPEFMHLAGVAIAMGAFGAAELIGGNGFIAVFVAGLVVGNTARTVCHGLQEFAEDEGQLLALIAFLVFGAVMVPPALEAFDSKVALYVLLSLTVVRMIPVALSLLGTGLRIPSVMFLGWFGPRGLATILFALLLSEARGVPNHEQLFHVATLTVAASVLAHGVTAAPAVAVYSKWIDRLRTQDPDGAECRAVPDLPVRLKIGQESVPDSDGS